MTTATAVTIEVPDLADVASVSDDELIARMQRYAEAKRTVDAGLAVLAGQVHARSSLELGYGGLAQRTGARTPDAFVARVTGASGPEARTMVTVGALMNEPSPWLARVAERAGAAEISIGVAAAIQAGLGTPNADIAADDLADAAQQLIAEVGGLSPEKAARRAREVRDELDEAGVADREAALRDKRFLRLIPQADGMTRLIGLLDPESAALVGDALDLVTAPRRGGPRFVDPTAKRRAQAIVDDPRTTEQLALDGLVEMIRIAAGADTGRVFGSHRPSVRVHVTGSDLQRRRGVAVIEGQTAAVSVVTAERLACGGILPILFDGARPLDLGRTERLYTWRQRQVLAAIWGGCPVPGCDRPPSWTEAHHITTWDRGGGTDIANGILLCRHHHMWVHNRGWTIRRTGDQYVLEPPPGELLAPMVLEPKNPVHRRRNEGGRMNG